MANRLGLFTAGLCLLLSTVAHPFTIEISDFNSPVSLATNWSVIIGDSDRFKDPLYDDSAAITIKLPGHLYLLTNVIPPQIVWYRIGFVLKGGLPEKSIGIRLGPITPVDETYFNGELIGKTGSFSPAYTDLSDIIRLYEIPVRLIRTNATNVIAVRFRGQMGVDKTYGINTEKPTIFEYGKLLDRYMVAESKSLLFVALYLFSALYFLFLFVNKPSDKEKLFFTLFLIFISVYSFSRLQWKAIFGWDLELWKRLEFMSLFLVGPLFVRFLYHGFIAGLKNRIEKAMNIYSFVYLCLGIFSAFLAFLLRDESNLGSYYNPFYIDTIYLGIVVSLSTLFYKIAKRDQDALTVVIGFLSFAVTIVIDIYGYTQGMNWERTISYGLAIMMLSIIGMLTSRFVRMRTQLESAYEKFRELDLLKDNFISNISDEMNHPTKNIQHGLAKLLGQEDIDESSRQRLYEQIYRNCLKASTIIDEVITISKIERDELRLNFNNAMLDSLLNKAIDEKRRQYAFLNLKVSVEDLSGIGIYVDPDYCLNVFRHLIENSFVFNIHQGKVEVFVCTKTQTQIEIGIHDTGTGIDSNLHSKIFMKFTRGESSFVGAGIGLYQSYLLLKLMNGSIRYVSDDKNGTTFYVTLPLSSIDQRE